MSPRKTIIEELEEAIAGQPIGPRARKLRRMSDLFMEGAPRYSESEVAVFDDVMMRLLDQMEMSVRSEISNRLAAIPNAPKKLIHTLAADSAIEVAGPVLAASPRLDETMLAEHARIGDQPRLLAISRRPTIGEAVTDILVQRGDRAVALSTVGNTGAQLSQAGRSILVERAKDDGELAAGVWSRTDIPRHDLLRLFTIASENVRRSLEDVESARMAHIREVVADVANRMQARIRASSRDYAAAQEVVHAMHRDGRLGERELQDFAAAGRFDETTVALSILCDLPVGSIERAMVQDRPDLVLLLARAIRLSWDCTKVVLGVRPGPNGMSGHQIESCRANFGKLRPETARKALQFLQLRERASMRPPVGEAVAS